MPNPYPPAVHVSAYAQAVDDGGVERAMPRLVQGWHGLGRRVIVVIGDSHGQLAREVPCIINARQGRSAVVRLGKVFR